MKLEECPQCYGTKFVFKHRIDIRTKERVRGHEVGLCDFCYGRGKIPWIDAMLNKPGPNKAYTIDRHHIGDWSKYVVYMKNDNGKWIKDYTIPPIQIPRNNTLKRQYRKKGKKPTVKGEVLVDVQRWEQKTD